MSGILPGLPQTDRFSWTLIAKLGAGLLLGFLLLRTGLGEYISGTIATLLAVVSSAVLEVFRGDVLRSGSELRSGETGYALSVTSACDGLGLTVTLLSTLAALAAPPFSWARYLAVAGAGFVLIQAFNLARILSLYGLLPATSAGFELVHFHIFPLLSALLIAGIVLLAGHRSFSVPAGALLRWCAIALAGAVIWHFVADAVTGAILVPLSSATIRLVPGMLVIGISEQGGGHFIDTTLVTSHAPVSLASLPFSPRDFAVGFPLLAASLLVANAPPKSKLLVALMALLGMALAVSAAAFTLAQGEAVAAGLTQLASSSRLESYEPPGGASRSVLAALQNCAVYFNLFIMPFVIFFLPTTRPPLARRAERGSRRRG
ncbi:hypothetical protein [Aestuariivirga sp.]|uniref:hypothetical protein n=1 Tax=Aestuariivirga sp. TaxID=2650926 RepID=UPI00391D1D41